MMDKLVAFADKPSLEFITGEYAVLPTRLSRHIRILNAGIRNKFHRTSFCLESQKRKFCSCHSVEAAKHHMSLLNLRKAFKTRPWRSNTVDGSTTDPFTADVSHLNPVELSRFQLVREIVAAIPGEKVTMGEICETMKKIAPVFTEDKNHKAVQVKPPRMHQPPCRPSPKLYSSLEDTKQEHLAARQTDDVPARQSVDQSIEVTSVSESVVSSVELPGTQTDDATSMFSGEDASVPDSNPQVTREFGDVPEITSTGPSGGVLTITSSTEAQNTAPVFITEVGYIPLKTGQKKVPRATIISHKNYREVIPFKPKLPNNFHKKRTEKHRVEDESQRSEKRVPVIRKTDPYGFSYKGGRVEEPRKKIVQHKLGPARPSNSTNNLDNSTKRVNFGRASASGNHAKALTDVNKSSSRGMYSNKGSEEDSISSKVKSISWREPVASVDNGVPFDNSPRTKWNTTSKKTQSFPPAKPLKPIMKPVTSTSYTLPFVKAGATQTTRLRRSKQSSPLSYLIIHEDTDGVCQRHRRWLVKTPDYLP